MPRFGFRFMCLGYANVLLLKNTERRSQSIQRISTELSAKQTGAVDCACKPFNIVYEAFRKIIDGQCCCSTASEAFSPFFPQKK